MTPESLKAWRTKMRWTKAVAADALGLSAKGYSDYESGKPLRVKYTLPQDGKHKPRPIPRTVALACAAITHRLEPEE